VMVRWLREQGLEAGSFSTEYGTQDDEAAAPLQSLGAVKLSGDLVE
jgi:hypothetical protein